MAKFVNEKIEILPWVIMTGIVLIVIGLGIEAINFANSPASYGKETQECFSRLTTLDPSLLQVNDPHVLTMEIKKDIIKNHLVPLCRFTYASIDEQMLEMFFPNVLFGP